MSWARAQAPGLLASFIVALAATFLSEHYGASAMLFALLLGMAVNFLSTEGRCAPGIALASRSLLRIGVALLGMRITLAQIEDSGWVVLTIVVPLLAVAWAVWLVRSLVATRDLRRGGDETPRRPLLSYPPRGVLLAFGVIVLAFGVARNLDVGPVFEYMGSEARGVPTPPS